MTLIFKTYSLVFGTKTLQGVVCLKPTLRGDLTETDSVFYIQSQYLTLEKKFLHKYHIMKLLL